jgi:hypothetical protein
MHLIGLPNPGTNEQRADMISSLIERGYANHTTLSHDPGRMHGFSEEITAERTPNWRTSSFPTSPPNSSAAEASPMMPSSK